MFVVKVTVRCDNCGLEQSSYGESIKECLSRRAFEKILKNYGWIKIHKKYNICVSCVKTFGMAKMRKKFGGEGNGD